MTMFSEQSRCVCPRGTEVRNKRQRQEKEDEGEGTGNKGEREGTFVLEGTKDCLWIGQTDAAHRKMAVYEGPRGMQC